MFIRRFEQVVYGKDIGSEEICKDNLKGMAIVKFQLASKVITRIKKTKRVSFSDHVSNIGKTLFIGMDAPHLVSTNLVSTWVLYMSFDRFLLAVESRDLSQVDKSIIRVSSFPSFNL